MLLLLYLLLVRISFGSSITFSGHLCYGDSYKLPTHFTPVLYNKTITYTPKVGEPKVVVSYGQSLDPRFKVLRMEIKMSYLSERDNDATLMTEERHFNSVILRLKNCRSTVKKLCGSFIYMRIPYDAEYFEFSGPDVLAPPTILWNRTSRLSIRGKVSGSDYEIKDITQKDSGYYRFRGSKDQLLRWDQFIVEEHVRSYNFDEGDIKIEYPIIFTPAQVKFKRMGAYNAKTVSESDGRFKITNSYLAIEYATPEDAGTYDFLDKDGNRILQVTLEVREVEKVWVSVVVLAAISCGFILCCCCMKKHCCEESSDKTNGPESETEAAAPSAAAPSVYHNGTQTTEPVTPLLSREPRVVFPDPPTYDEAGGHIDPPPPYEECGTQPSAPPVPTYSSQQDTPPVPAEPIVNSSEPTVSNAGAEEATTFTAYTFDSEPHFELRGTVFPSTSPLNSDGSNTAQYNSDKLNF